MDEIYDYITERLKDGEKVKIEIVGKKNQNDYLEMDWIIDNKFILKDMPFETFEGEDTTYFHGGTK